LRHAGKGRKCHGAAFPAAQLSSRKLCVAASELLSHGGENHFGGWSIADVDLTLMLNR